jgi:transcriptional regulator GlxA family with amidase domain
VAAVPRLLDILPTVVHTAGVLRDITAVVVDGVAPFELGVLCEVFGTDRTADGFPALDFAVCSPGARPVTTTAGFALHPSHGLDRLSSADLIAIPALPVAAVPEELLDALRAAVDRGARVLSLCTGAFVLGEAGLLDGRSCTTHWMHAAELAERYPAARVDADVLYVEDGPVITSAGTAAGIDASLHVVRAELGVDVATAFARRMVVPPHRDGGQAQYVQTPLLLHDAESLQGLLDWVCSHLDEPHTVESLAARAHLSPRTFARRFRAETGTTPYAWLSARRVELAQSLLETTDEPVERIAVLTGFGAPAALRHHFTAAVRTTPQAYRRTFQCPDLRTG